MKRILTLLLLLCTLGTAHAVDNRQVYFIPLAETVVQSTEIPAHLLQKNESPSAVNVEFENGNIKKRAGITAITQTAGEIRGYYQATTNYGLLGIDNDQTTGQDPPPGVKLWEWDGKIEVPTFRDLNVNHLTTTASYVFATVGGGNALETPALFAPNDLFFVNHFDAVIGTCTIICNGDDFPHKYVHADQSYTGIYSDWQERNVDFLYDPGVQSVTVTGHYPASFYNALYLGKVSETDSSGTTVDDMAVIWSDIDDATDWDVTEYYQQRAEGGTNITGMVELGDYLYLLKEDSTWQIAPYSNFKRISQRIGATNNHGILASDTLFVNDDGKIYDALTGAWISEPIHTLLASQEPGTWDISIVEDQYDNELLVSSGKYLFTYNISKKHWETYKFNEKIRVLSSFQAGRPFAQWAGRMGLHTQYTLAEEDVLSDAIMSYGADQDQMVVFNHFNKDMLTGDNRTIEMEYQTRQDSAGDTQHKKRFRTISLQGRVDDTTNQYFTVYGWFGNAPADSPNWTELGTIYLDADGYGEIWLDQRSIWFAVRIKESSSNSVRLSKIGVWYNESTQR